jgi:uncharacterized protein (DUF302 family)
MKVNGLISVASAFGPKETADRLAKAVADQGVTLVARIDHALAAEKAGLSMRPAEVLIFGNPRAGTPLMVASPTLAIDLPLKALIWQDRDGTTWLSYNDPVWLVQRHGVDEGAQSQVLAMRNALEMAARRATSAAA